MSMESESQFEIIEALPDLTNYASSHNARRWTKNYPNEARRWLNLLPSLADHYARAWDVTIQGPLEGGSVSVVMAVTREDKEAVLKINTPWSFKDISYEAQTLDYWAGVYGPRLLRHDRHAILMERLYPVGIDQFQPSEIAQIITQISKDNGAIPAVIPPLAIELGRRFMRASQSPGSQRVTKELAMSALTTSLCLATDGQGHMGLVHGDLKSKNIARCDEMIKVYDPDPAVGDTLYDAALWAISDPHNILERCGELGHSLGADPQRIGAWAVALAVPEICLASETRAQATKAFVDQMMNTKLQSSFYT